MTDLFDHIQTRKANQETVLGNFRITDLNLISPHPQTFVFTVEGKGEAAGQLATIAIRNVQESNDAYYEVDFTDTNTSKTESYGALTYAQVDAFLQTGQRPETTGNQ